MTINLTDVSTRAALLVIAETLEKRAEKDPVKPRKIAMLDAAQQLRALSTGRAVTKLLEYLE